MTKIEQLYGKEVTDEGIVICFNDEHPEKV